MDHLVQLASEGASSTGNTIQNNYWLNVDQNLLIAIAVILGAILLLFALYLGFKLLKKLPKKQVAENIFKELADRKNLRDKLQAKLEAADVDERTEIQARIDKNEKQIKALEKKAKLPKTSA